MAVSLEPVAFRRGPTPPPAPLEMPRQDLRRHVKVRKPRPRLKTRAARLLTFGGAVALTAYASHEMYEVVSVFGMTGLQAVMLAFFTVTFGWIALSASAAVAGVLFGGTRRRARDDTPIAHRTALVMPICNEEPWPSFAALYAMADALAERGVAEHFEIFVLSDTRNPDIWVKETAAFQALREAVGDRMHVWYRRRQGNAGRKAGNIEDFVKRWGARYECMVVLDADSLMAPETLLALAREMAADPQLGILQTVPRLAGGTTLLARLQQFAGTVYGPIVARGIAAWQGDDGNYWGHNAIIRVRAFAAAAGLPELPGRKPFGGTIMSHDFVEAALVRRAGWSVRMLPTLGGSWEASPPTLLDVASRDRRWAQGNIQHLAVVGAKGLRWPNRMHMLIGVMSYVASPLWLAFILVGLAVTAQVATMQFEYFTDEPSLFPRWPRFDTERMIALFVFAMAVLLLPKALGVVRALFDRELRKACGIVRLALSVVIETTLSALYAPISMMMQSRQVWEVLCGQDSGWSVQQRALRRTPWSTLFRRHWLHSVFGLLLTAALAYIALPLLPWMSPTLLGLGLALPLSAASGSVLLGKLLRALGLLKVPEERRLPDVMARRDEFEARLEAELGETTLDRLVADDGLRRRHFAAVLPPASPRGNPDLSLLAARAKVGEARSMEEALDWLSPPERLALLTDEDLFDDLVSLRPAPRPADSYGQHAS
ncbi:MAG TPA: glucans biosynthesis glucosyltransferase MdoH [Gammaproteobacteria bacterium]